MKYLLVVLLFSLLPKNEQAEIPCEINYEREVVNSDAKRLDLTPQYFFSFTPSEIKSFYKENNLLNAYCQISKNGGLFSLNLNLILSSSIIKNEYGVISNDSNLIIHFIKDGKMTIKCTTGSVGKINTEINRTNYSIGYQLDKSQIKRLKKYDIDRVDIEWSSGMESYSIFEVDAILEQLSCMEKLGIL